MVALVVFVAVVVSSALTLECEITFTGSADGARELSETKVYLKLGTFQVALQMLVRRGNQGSLE